MDPLRLDSKDMLAPAWARAGVDGQLPVRTEQASGLGSAEEAGGAAARRPWWRSVLRVARDAVIGLALIASVPVTLVSVRGVSAPWNMRQAASRLEAVEPMRALTVPINTAITPMQAGMTLHAVNRSEPDAAFPMRALGEPVARPWDDRTLSPGIFAWPSTPSSYRGPLPAVIFAAAAKGFTPEELTYLRTVAEAPVWDQVDIVASAAEVDIIGGAYQLPFGESASAFTMPTVSYSGTTALADAGVARAAYYMAIGDPDRAEAALKAIVSLGFVYADDGYNIQYALTGRMMMGIARAGLHELYTMTGNEAGMALTTLVETASDQAWTPRTPEQLAADRAMMLTNAGDPSLPRAFRLEQVKLQSLASCRSASTMLLGEDDALQSMYARARTALVRYPSEQAYLDLVVSTSATLPAEWLAARWVGERLVMGAAQVTGMVLRNPRIETCTRLALDNPR